MFYWVFTGFLLGFTGFYWFLPGFHGFHWVFTKYEWVTVGYYCVFLKRNSVNDACRVIVIDVVGNEGHDQQKREKKPKKNLRIKKKKSETLISKRRRENGAQNKMPKETPHSHREREKRK